MDYWLLRKVTDRMSSTLEAAQALSFLGFPAHRREPKSGLRQSNTE